mgnify:CR=1 FL=1
MNRIEKSAEVMASLGVGENDLAASFPEFEAVRNRFVYAEARTQGELDDRRRALVVVACLATLEADDLAEQIHAAMIVGVTPVELQEVFHQVVPYIGLTRPEHGLRVLAEVLRAEGVSLPLPPQSTTDENSRLEKGIHAQSAIFGEDHILPMRASAPEDQAFMQDYLSAYCFGDTYTRNGLELETRELLTFVAIISMGGCDPQARAHAAGNVAVGNDARTLFAAIATCVPYLGFPRSLNAMAAVNNI